MIILHVSIVVAKDFVRELCLSLPARSHCLQGVKRQLRLTHFPTAALCLSLALGSFLNVDSIEPAQLCEVRSQLQQHYLLLRCVRQDELPLLADLLSALRGLASVF